MFQRKTSKEVPSYKAIQQAEHNDTVRRIQEEEEQIDKKILNIFYNNKYLLHRIFIPLFEFSFSMGIKSHDLRNLIKNAYNSAEKHVSSIADLDEITEYFLRQNRSDIIHYPRYYDEDVTEQIMEQLIDIDLNHGLLYLSDFNAQTNDLKATILNLLESNEGELIRIFLKCQIKIALIKIFTYEKELATIEENEELLKILTNAAFKYKNLDVISEKTYDLFLDYYKLGKNQFSFENYAELMRVFFATKQYCNEFYKSNEMFFDFDIEVLSFEEISDNIISQKLYKKYDAKKLLFSVLYETASNYTNLHGFLFELEDIDKEINKINHAATKDDLLNGDYKNVTTSIVDIDLMSGVEFEEFLCNYFNTHGYECSTTKTSGDQGIDLVAKRDGYILAIQVKCYTGTVGNHAIMEAVAGTKYYNANQAMVITNSTFTKSAIELAQVNNVILWDRQVLIEKLANA